MPGEFYEPLQFFYRYGTDMVLDLAGINFGRVAINSKDFQKIGNHLMLLHQLVCHFPSRNRKNRAVI